MEKSGEKEQKPTILEGFVSISFKEYERLIEREKRASFFEKEQQKMIVNNSTILSRDRSRLKADFRIYRDGIAAETSMSEERRESDLNFKKEELEKMMTDKIDSALSEISGFIPGLKNMGLFARIFCWKSRIDKIINKYGNKQHDT